MSEILQRIFALRKDALLANPHRDLVVKVGYEERVELMLAIQQHGAYTASVPMNTVFGLPIVEVDQPHHLSVDAPND